MTTNIRRTSGKTIIRFGLSTVALAAPISFISSASAQSSNADLPPIVVQGTQPKAKAASPATTAKKTVAPVKQKSAAPPAEQQPAVAKSEPNQSEPGLNLAKPNTSGSRLDMTPLETPASVDVISGETARERGQNSVVEAVTQNAPGFSSVAPPTSGTAFAARGFQGNNSVMQLYDGTRLFPGRGNITFPFNTWSVDRIEVLHGPASVLYGDGAIGGIINVIPKKPITEGFFNEAQVLIDSNLTRRASLDSGGALSKALSYRFNVSADASDGWVDDGDSENLGISGAVRLQATRDLAFTVSHDYGDQQPMTYYGVPIRNGVLERRTRENNYNVEDSLLEFKDSWTQFKTEWSPSEMLSFRNVAYYLDSRREFRNADTYVWNAGSQLVDLYGSHILQKQDQIGNRFDATLKTNLLGSKNETVVGFDVNRGKFGYSGTFITYPFDTPIGSVDFDDPERVYFPDPDRLDPGFASEVNQKSLFIEDRLVVNDYLSLVGGVRWEETSLTRDDKARPAGSFGVDFHAFNWRAGAVITPVRGLAFFGQYAVATDPLQPTLELEAARADFDQTRGTQTEIGVKQELWNGALEWTVSAYDIVKTDLLVADPANLFRVIQIGQQSSRGVEAAVGLRLGDGWRIDANGALLRAQYDDFQFIDLGTFQVIDFTGKVPILVPEKTGNVWLSWAFAQNWQASVGVQYIGQSFENFSNTVERPSYTITNLGLQWRPTEKSRLDFRVKNLFDEFYTPYLRSADVSDQSSPYQAYIAPPRTFEASLTTRF